MNFCFLLCPALIFGLFLLVRCEQIASINQRMSDYAADNMRAKTGSSGRLGHMEGALSSYTEKERNDFIERHFTRDCLSVPRH